MNNPFFKNTGPYDINYLLDSINLNNQKFSNEKISNIADLSSSKELNETDISKIKNELASNFGANIKLNYKYEPSLIGGLIIKVGSIMVDTSIKSKLKQLETKMLEA